MGPITLYRLRSQTRQPKRYRMAKLVDIPLTVAMICLFVAAVVVAQRMVG